MDKPIGVMPQRLWEYQCRQRRIDALLEAMYRYSAATLPALPEWITELVELMEASQRYLETLRQTSQPTAEPTEMSNSILPTCCQFHNTGGNKAVRCGPQTADKTAYRLDSQQTESIVRRMDDAITCIELSRADAEAILSQIRIRIELRIR